MNKIEKLILSEIYNSSCNSVISIRLKINSAIQPFAAAIKNLEKEDFIQRNGTQISITTLGKKTFQKCNKKTDYIASVSQKKLQPEDFYIPEQNNFLQNFTPKR